MLAAMPTPATLSALLHRHALPLGLALACLAVALAGPGAMEALRYDREAIAAGQWWRLLSANLAHLGWSHLLLNLAGLALVWALFRPFLPLAGWLTALLLSALAVTLGLWLLDPRIGWYVGLSGVLHGLFVAGALGAVGAGERRELLLLAVITAKLAWEQWHGPLPGSAEAAGGPVVVESHLYGAISGALAAVPFLRRRGEAR